MAIVIDKDTPKDLKLEAETSPLHLAAQLIEDIQQLPRIGDAPYDFDATQFPGGATELRLKLRELVQLSLDNPEFSGQVTVFQSQNYFVWELGYSIDLKGDVVSIFNGNEQ